MVFHPSTNFAGRRRSELDAMGEEPVAQVVACKMLEPYVPQKFCAEAERIPRAYPAFCIKEFA